MNKLLLRICIALSLLPALVFAGLWLGVYWRVVWWAACGAGVLWCAYLAFRHARGGAHRLHGWLFPAALVQTGLWALAIALSVDTDQPANRALHDAVAFVSSILALVLLLTGTVGFGGQAVRLLRSNQAVPLQPRRALWGALLLAGNVACWTFVILTSQVLSNQKTNLTIVNGWPYSDWPLVTPARYAKELLAHHYIWMDDSATPQLGWWRPASAMAEPDDVIRQNAHPTDRFSGAYLLTEERKENERAYKKRAFGLTIADEVDTPAEGAPPAAPELGLRVMDVKLGSPAALAGVQRGDTLVAVNGMPLAQWRAAQVAPLQTTTIVAIQKPGSAATAVPKQGNSSQTGEPIGSFGVRTRSGALITLAACRALPDSKPASCESA